MKIHIKPKNVNRFKLKNTFIEKVPEYNPLTKTMKVFFVILQATFFLDFGFIQGSRREVVIKKILTFTMGTLFCAYCTALLSRIEIVSFKIAWKYKIILQHYLFILILLFTRDLNFRQFLVKLHEIDAKIEVASEKFHLDFKIIAFFVLSSVTKLFLVELSWIHNDSLIQEQSLQILLLMMHLACDVPLIVLSFIFLSIYNRITALRKLLKHKIFFDDKVIGDKTILVYSHRIYVSLVDLTESIMRTYDYIFLISLILNLPTILAVIYSAIRHIKANAEMAFYIVELCTVLHIIFVKFAPAISAGGLSTAAQQTKVLLHNKLIEEKDPEKLNTIWKFLDYIDTRSFRLHVFMVVPLDASLPMKVLDLCCTYVIVLIQLTHLY